MIKYSEIKELLNINVEKHLNDGFAALTHYWQSPDGVNEHIKVKALEYLHAMPHSSNIIKNLNVNEITFDVPFPPSNNPKFTFIDLFAGIGGIRLAFQNSGGKCVFSSEWDKFAKITYELNFGEVPFGDITKINEASIPDHDVLLAGFPCQPFSIAGVSKKNALGRSHGFLDETQGTLFFDIARILEHKRPTAFLLENVKNLVSHDKGKTFKIIKGTLEEDLEYKIYPKVLNSKHFVPQHRERIIIVGFRKDVIDGIDEFGFSDLPEPQRKFKGILDTEVDPKYTLSDSLWKYLQDYAAKHKAKGNGFGFGLTDFDGIARTLSARYYKDGSEILIRQNEKNPRRLTPVECSRLQGYPKEFKIDVSDNQAYKQFGNSVTVPLIQSVAEQLVLNLERINGSDKT